jgi:hypothetical protein
MTAVELTEDNIEEYAAFLTEDVAENILRKGFIGYVVTGGEGKLAAGILFEILGNLDSVTRESSIKWIRIDNREAADALFEVYDHRMQEENVSISRFSVSRRDHPAEEEALKEHGFATKLTEGDVISVTLEQLHSMSIIGKEGEDDRIVPLSELSVREFNKAKMKYFNMGLHGICNDLEFLSVDFFEKDVSCCLQNGMNVDGMLLLHLTPSEMLILELMACIGKENTKLLPKMIRFSVLTAMLKYPGDTRVLIDRHNLASLLLSEYLLPEGFGMLQITGERREDSI